MFVSRGLMQCVLDRTLDHHKTNTQTTYLLLFWNQELCSFYHLWCEMTL